MKYALVIFEHSPYQMVNGEKKYSVLVYTKVDVGEYSGDNYYWSKVVLGRLVGGLPNKNFDSPEEVIMEARLLSLDVEEAWMTSGFFRTSYYFRNYKINRFDNIFFGGELMRRLV